MYFLSQNYRFLYLLADAFSDSLDIRLAVEPLTVHFTIYLPPLHLRFRSRLVSEEGDGAWKLL